MKKFTYQARDNEGRETSGVIESLSETQAARVLQEKGLLVISLSPKRGALLDELSLGLFKTSVSERDVATFVRMLSTMLATGLPLTDSLINLSLQMTGYFREVIRSLLRDIQSGISLSEAMGRYPQIFSNLAANLVKAGEASGKMDEALEKLADTMEANLDFKAKVKGAMTYPAIIVVAMTGISIFMITTIIPKISEVYKEFGAVLPLPTRILIGLSDIITGYFFIFIPLIIIVFLALKTLQKNQVSEYLINNALFKIPIFGPLHEEMTLTIMTRTLGTLLSAGVAILDALKIVAKIIDNNHFRSGLLSAATAVEKGVPLSLAIKRHPEFPMIVTQLVAIGEETGTVDQSLSRLAKFYQDSVERRVKTLTTVMEPVMLLMMGAMVGGLSLAVLLPMFNLVNVIK